MRKINMKKQIVQLLTVLAIAGTFAIAVAAQTKSDNQNSETERSRCRENTIGGSYGTNITGTFIIPPPPGSTNPPTVIPLASVGRLTFDGVGNMWGKSTDSFGGEVTRYTATGTYTVARDCTGTLTINLSNGFVLANDIVIVDGGKEIYMIQTNPGAVITGIIKRQ